MQNYLKSKHTVLIPQVSKLLWKIFGKMAKQIRIEDGYNMAFISIFGLNNLVKYPVLEWKSTFIKNAIYIDNITSKDMTEPIMIGNDHHNRYFICLKLHSNGTLNTQVIFQKYKNSKLHWCYSYESLNIISVSGYLIDNGFIRDRNITQNIRKICTGESIVYCQDRVYLAK